MDNLPKHPREVERDKETKYRKYIKAYNNMLQLNETDIQMDLFNALPLKDRLSIFQSSWIDTLQLLKKGIIIEYTNTTVHHKIVPRDIIFHRTLFIISPNGEKMSWEYNVQSEKKLICKNISDLNTIQIDKNHIFQLKFNNEKDIKYMFLLENEVEMTKVVLCLLSIKSSYDILNDRIELNENDPIIRKYIHLLWQATRLRLYELALECKLGLYKAYQIVFDFLEKFQTKYNQRYWLPLHIISNN